MLKIHIPASEDYNEATSEFIQNPEYNLELEHSLVSLSKWESEWEIPFLNDEKKTNKQIFYYIKCMDLSPDTPDEVYARFSSEDFEAVNEYISAKRSATWFADNPKTGRKETITSELIYYWMIALTIPFDCETWHLRRLLNLITVCNEKNKPQKSHKPTKSSLSARAQMNAARRQQMNSEG